MAALSSVAAHNVRDVLAQEKLELGVEGESVAQLIAESGPDPLNHLKGVITEARHRSEAYF